MKILPSTGSLRTLARPSFWSNIFYLLPLWIALEFGAVFLSVLIALVFVASASYHFWSESDRGILLRVDQFFGGILALTNAGLVAFGGFTPPYFYFVLGYGAVSALFFSIQKEEWGKWISGDMLPYAVSHSLWHLFSSAVVVFSILTFYA